MQIKDQLVVVTGASRGLGAAIARAFIREGAMVIVNYFQSKRNAEVLVGDLGKRALALKADVRSRNEVDLMFRSAADHFGREVNTVVNNALIDYRFDPIAKKNADNILWEDYLSQLEGSVRGSMNTVQAALEGMKKRKFGRIINIGSNLVQNPVVPYHDYTTAKAALLGFSRNMANELGQFGITVNMISGGLLKTTDASKATSSEVFSIIKGTTPLRRVTSPEEAADAVLFFASPWARAVTGQNLIVDGGLVMD